jgi:uncharacterized protein YkwD
MPVMRRVFIALGLAAVATIAACDAGGSGGVTAATSEKLDYANGHPLLLPNSDPGVTVFESELLRLVNDHRLNLGKAPLVPSTLLGDAARAHSRHMIDHRFFAHASPEGLTPAERLALANVDWSAVGENIAAGYSTPQAVYDAWMASPEHRANMESDSFSFAGIGYAQDADPSSDFPQVHYWAMALLRR